MRWLVSLFSSVDFWEGIEYVAEAIVIVGALVEVLADFEHILKGDDKRRHRVAKRAAIALIIGLAIELGALVRTNQLFTDTIASLYREARDAYTRAADAQEKAKESNDRATGASDKATRAEDRANQSEIQSASAIEHAAANAREASRLNKLAQDEA